MSYVKVISISVVVAVVATILVRLGTSAKPMVIAKTVELDEKDIIDSAKVYLKLCGHDQEFDRFSVIDPQTVEGIDPSHVLPNYLINAYGKNDNRMMSVTLSKRSLALVLLGDESGAPEESVLPTEQPYAFITEQEASEKALNYARKLFPEWSLHTETTEFWLGDHNGVRSRGTARFAVRRKVGNYDFIQKAAFIILNTRDGSCSNVQPCAMQDATAEPVVGVTEEEAFRVTGSKRPATKKQLGWWAPKGEQVARLTYFFEMESEAGDELSRTHRYFVDAETGQLVLHSS